MPDWDKGVLKVADGVVLGNPLLEVPEPRLRETGILTVEQLRAFEIRLHRYIGAQVADSVNLLSERLMTVDERTQSQIERIGREAAERGIDQAVRLHAVNQRVGERIKVLTTDTTERFERVQTDFHDLRVWYEGLLMSNIGTLYAQMTVENEKRHETMRAALEEFQAEVRSRSALGRLRRLKAWLGSLVRRVRYGR